MTSYIILRNINDNDRSTMRRALRRDSRELLPLHTCCSCFEQSSCSHFHPNTLPNCKIECPVYMLMIIIIMLCLKDTLGPWKCRGVLYSGVKYRIEKQVYFIERCPFVASFVRGSTVQWNHIGHLCIIIMQWFWFGTIQYRKTWNFDTLFYLQFHCIYIVCVF